MSLVRRVLVERRKIVVPLTVLFAANVGVIAFLVLPLRQSVASRRSQALEAMADVASARREETQARLAREGALGAVEDVRRFQETVLPRDFDAAVQVTGFWLNQVAEQSGVQFERGKYDPEVIEDSRLERMTAQATLTGEYEGVRRFLHAVETSPQFVIIDRVELAQPNEVGDTRLELLLDVSTYYRGRSDGSGRRAGR